MTSRHTYASLNTPGEHIPLPYESPSVLSPGFVEQSVPSTTHPANISAPYRSEYFPPLKQYERNNVLRKYAGLLRAAPPLLAAFTWSTLMLYFFFWYITRPAELDGSWPRIGASYAMFPFVSCIGARKEIWFESLSIVVAILLWLAFGTDYYLGRRSSTGIWWRRGKVVTASVSNVFLIALSFESVDEHHRYHLIFTGFQITCMCMAKACDWNLQNALRWHTPNNEHLWRVKMPKRIAALVAAPCGVLVGIGVFICSARIEGGKVIFSPTCWSFVSFAAPAEWTMSWVWILFILTIAYDNYHADYTLSLLGSTPRPIVPLPSRIAFWRKWTRERQNTSHKLADLDSERLVPTHAPSPVPSNTKLKPSEIMVSRNNGEQCSTRLPSEWTSTPRASLDQADVASAPYGDDDGDTELEGVPPTRPLSLTGTTQPCNIGKSFRYGEA